MTIPELEATLTSAQRGLFLRPIFGQVLTIFLKNKEKGTHEALVEIIHHLDYAVSNCVHGNDDDDCGFVVAFAPSLWGQWTEGQEKFDNISTTTLDQGINLKNTGGDVLIYIKSLNDPGTSAKLAASIMPLLEPLVNQIEVVEAGKRSDGRVFGGRYLDHITNPNDPMSMVEDVLLPKGATFCLTQKFIFDWPDLSSQSGDALDAVIGRRPDGVVLSQHADRAHIHRAHVLDENQDQRMMLRQGLPFGASEGGQASREEGLMFVAFCNDQQRFEDILENMIGERAERPVDRLMDFVQGIGGSYWYVPSAKVLGISGVRAGTVDDIYREEHWDVRSRNGYLFYNSRDYMQCMSSGGGGDSYVGGDPPSVRILSLLSRAFSHWRDGWMMQQSVPRLPHLNELISSTAAKSMPTSITERKGLANFVTLSHLLSSPDSKIARDAGLTRCSAKELIVGVIPDFTLGRGREVVPYLDDGEKMAAWLKASLDESSAMGHVVPNFQILLEKGVGGMLQDLHQRESKAKKQGNSKKASFYRSCVDSFQGVRQCLQNWAEIIRRAQHRTKSNSDEDRTNQQDIIDRLERLTDHPPESFHDAVQLIYSVHCCLHLVGELTAFGRLDQLLWPFLDRDLKSGRISSSLDRAQEIIDMLWIKIGENAFVNRAFVHDSATYGTGSVDGRGGNPPRGGSLNQWVQQITVGGYKPTDSEHNPEGGANPVTLLCLRASRRIPVNAPCLSLRVYRDIPQEYLHEASKSILSGGAHPCLYNDDKLCEGLFQSGKTVTRAWSRDYAADGCFEPMFAGASEFTFGSVPTLLALEQTLNEGATYNDAGSVYLRGLKRSFRSPRASDIATFDQLQDIFLRQLEWLIIQCYSNVLTGYGNLADVCPSPLLSALIDGCVQSGRDLTSGGAKFHIISPMCVGVANTIDSLYAIKKLCFDPATARVTLPELVTALICDWGHDMREPFQDSSLGHANAEAKAVRYRELRHEALKLPKWGATTGTGEEEEEDDDQELRELGSWLVSNMVQMAVDAIRGPAPALKPILDDIYARHGDGPEKFEFVVQPGVGTFEGYVGDGLACGASADGRRRGMPIASDMSPVPHPQDLPTDNTKPKKKDIYRSMQCYYADQAIEIGISSSAPVNLNIPEDFPLDKLEQFITDYARGGKVGGNLLTITCADIDTCQRASEDAEKYELLRVRLGGWSEFYSTMFPEYQAHHQRRRYFDVLQCPSLGE